METRANYILVGAFTLAGFLGLMGFFFWFANIELNRQFAYYDIDFTSISGLSEASDVRFAGLPVGQVVSVRLSPENDGLVRVRIEVDAATPVRADSVATIEAQGVTGVSFVGISAGRPEAPLLTAVSTLEVPRIEAGQSVLQTLSEDAPKILSETLELLSQLRELIGEENQGKVRTILANVETSSAAFSVALEDFASVTGAVSGFAKQIDEFNTTLNTLTQDLSGVLSEAETALSSITALTSDTRVLVGQGGATLDRVDSALVAAQGYISDSLRPATDNLELAIADIQATVTALGEDASGLTAVFADTGAAATARLTEARETIAAANAMIIRIEDAMQTIDDAASRFDGLLQADAQPLIAELRSATALATDVIADMSELAQGDLAAIFEEIRTATRSASDVVATVGENLKSVTARLNDLAEPAEKTLEAARVTFGRANETLTAVEATLQTGDRALIAAEQALATADRVMNEDLTEIAGRLRTTLDKVDAAVAAVADEIPVITADLRSASSSAKAAFASVESVLGESGPAFREFAATTLPQYGRLAADTRTLVKNFDTLIEQIRRDPSRFFLDQRAPEYRR
ncbi:MCE family protein [Maliponia aquimaris]|uniref:Mce related protein n=1 Tax=Maliponia aquimaris TaxID=1673631 RepID=A0A238L7E8_9RHOB|nr:MlaD family protein [Maliponia aquimaris]SMX50292.1 mce related protein [Maliponia aquimaris]